MHAVTSATYENMVHGWSRDWTAVYFASNRTYSDVYNVQTRVLTPVAPIRGSLPTDIQTRRFARGRHCGPPSRDPGILSTYGETSIAAAY